MFNLRLAASALAAAASLSLAGCGGGAQSAAPKGPVERHVFVSAVDCEASGKYKIEDCSKQIDAAITAHEKTAPSYKSENGCEAKEGIQRCERSGDDLYRPRLAAFVFEMVKDKPAAKPLYPTLDGKTGFRGSDKKNVLAKDESNIFSKSALAAAEIIAQTKAKSKK